MIVRFKKIAGSQSSGAVLTCVRDDGTSTWQRPTDTNAAFFAMHDLTHFVVESELSEVQGFFSLIADGWDIADFANPLNARGQELPDQARQIELLIGQLDMERASQDDWSAEQFNQYMDTFQQQRNVAASFTIDSQQLARIKTSRDELIDRWQAVPIGESMELIFEPALESKES